MKPSSPPPPIQAEAAERGRAELRLLKEQLAAATAQQEVLQEQIQGEGRNGQPLTVLCTSSHMHG